MNNDNFKLFKSIIKNQIKKIVKEIIKFNPETYKQ